MQRDMGDMKVLVLGSGPDAIEVKNWDISRFDAVVAINNAWRLRPDWTHLIHPEDFPADRRPAHPAAPPRVATPGPPRA